MKDVFDDELTIFWKNYNYLMEKVGYVNVLKLSTQELQPMFMLKYKQVFDQVLEANAYKEENQRSYNILKLRRVLGLWVNKKLINIEGGVRYSSSDEYKQFPKFQSQNPIILPTENLINRLRIKALTAFVEKYEIPDRRVLRASLITILDIDEQQATSLTTLYREMMTTKGVNDYSQKNEEGLE